MYKQVLLYSLSLLLRGTYDQQDYNSEALIPWIWFFCKIPFEKCLIYISVYHESNHFSPPWAGKIASYIKQLNLTGLPFIYFIFNLLITEYPLCAKYYCRLWEFNKIDLKICSNVAYRERISGTNVPKVRVDRI